MLVRPALGWYTKHLPYRITSPVPDPIALSSDAEMRALAERALTAQYEIDREIGRGGMGIVYRARDRRLKRIVAIKVLPPELAFRGEIRQRFLREAETAAQLSHPNIVPIYSVDEKDGLVYFVMACVEGPTLAKRLHDEGRVPVGDARRILCEVADALAYAHARGVVHRDIKPDNILLDKDDGRAMVTDFGIARAIQEGADSRLTATGVAIGTPAYMSPEQAAGDREIDGRSDLYALGVVGYQMLAGRLPFQALEPNRAWFELALLAQDLLAWLRLLVLEGDLKLAKPKRLRHRLLHVAGRVTRSGRRRTLHLPASWPWRDHLTTAFERLIALAPG